MEHTPCTIACESESTLKYDGDKYDGVIVKEQSLPETKDEFAQMLKQSLRAWKAKGRRGVWLRIPVSKIDFTSVAIEFGFVMHHAEKDYIMLTHWLSEDENMLPSNASHQVGVGCVVMNNEGTTQSFQLNSNNVILTAYLTSFESRENVGCPGM